MNEKRSGIRRAHTFRGCIGVLIVIAALATQLVHISPFTTHAESNVFAVSWRGAPEVPAYRSPAEWLIDTGWKSREELYNTTPNATFQVGDTAEFLLLDSFGRRSGELTLRVRTEHASFWVEPGVDVDMTDLEYAADTFERQIWSVTRNIFGTIDDSAHVHLFHQASISSQIMGAFIVEDQCPKSLCPNSNERDALYINLELAPLGSPGYFGLLAHELQHLIRYKLDGNERLWLDEGLSQLAQHLNGYPVSLDQIRQFLAHSDHRLNSWTLLGLDRDKYYGAAYLFTLYLFERFGVELIGHIARSDLDGLAAVQDALVAIGQEVSVDDVFADWILANYLDDPVVGTGNYYYHSLDLPHQLQTEIVPSTFTGFTRVDTVNQYGADYIQLQRPGTYTITFDGSDVAKLVCAAPHSGKWMWWSFNGSTVLRD